MVRRVPAVTTIPQNQRIQCVELRRGEDVVDLFCVRSPGELVEGADVCRGGVDGPKRVVQPRHA